MNSQEQLIERLTRFYREAGGEVSASAPVWVPGKQRTVRWLQPALASLMLVALAVGLAVTLRIVREQAQRKTTPPHVVSPVPAPSPSSSATASPSPSPSATANWVTRHIAVGQVQAMSLDVAAIFALYDPYPVTGGIRVARVDRSTGAVTTAGPFPHAWQMARVTAGLWIGAGADPAGADTQWLTLVDPVTLKVKQRVRLPGEPTLGTYSMPQLAGTSDLLWSAYGNSLYRLDATTGRILSSQTLPGTASSVSIDISSYRLYVGVNPTTPQSDQAMVIELDAGTGAHLASAPTGGAGLGGPQVAAAPDGVWIAYATGMMGAVEHRTALDLTLLPEPPAQHANGIHVVLGGGTLWLVDSMAQRVACADLRTGAIVASVDATNVTVLVADANGSYLGDREGVGFLRPDPPCPH